MRNDTNYEICVDGRLEQSWSDWFEGLQIRQEISADKQGVCTVLSGCLDQAGLHGVMNKIRDLGLVLISVNPVSDKPD